MSEMPRMNHERDKHLSEIYSAVKPETPSPALDDAIRAAARREVGVRPRSAGVPLARRWQMPFSIAAVIVLCVSLVTVMRDEGGELSQAPRADAPVRSVPESVDNASAVQKAGQKTELATESSRANNIGLKLPSGANAPLSGVDAYSLATPGKPIGVRGAAAETQQESKHRIEADAPESVARRTQSSAFPQKADIAGAPREAVTSNAVKDMERRDASPDQAAAATGSVTNSGARAAADNTQAPAAGAAGFGAVSELRQQPALADQRRELEVAQSPPAVITAAPVAAAVLAPKSAASEPRPVILSSPAKPATMAAQAGAVSVERPRLLEKSAKSSMDVSAEMANLSPDKWLERIEDLRQRGRPDEARAALVEFRKRYPDYVLPASLRDWALQ